MSVHAQGRVWFTGDLTALLSHPYQCVVFIAVGRIYNVLMKLSYHFRAQGCSVDR